ncbi:hypothetical protein D3C84_1023920 [compost metagenome]
MFFQFIGLGDVFQNPFEQGRIHRVDQQRVVSPRVLGQQLEHVGETFFWTSFRQTQCFQSFYVFVVGHHVDATLYRSQVSQVNFNVFLQFNTELVHARFQRSRQVLTDL